MASEGYTTLIEQRATKGGYVPLRTCIGCRTRRKQAELFRIAAQGDGVVGLWQGRGRCAYVCRNDGCLEAAFNKSRLDRALKTQLRLDSREALLNDLRCELR